MTASDHVSWENERAAYLLGALDERERSEFEAHLGGCDRCRAELRWLQPAVDALPAAVEQLEPPPGLRDRILGAVEGDPVEPPRRAPQQERRGAARQPFWSRLSQRPALVAATAAVALAVGIAAGYGLRGDAGSPETVATTVPIEAAQPAIRATGGIVHRDGTWTLDVSRMPDLRSGDVYQVWMRSGNDLQPSVLFVPSRDGTAKIVLPPQTAAADEMLVTREPSGGSQEPTSAPMMSATLQ